MNTEIIEMPKTCPLTGYSCQMGCMQGWIKFMAMRELNKSKINSKNS